MSNHDIITDDYVADLLAKEAIMGPADKKPANMPKPNTRFLRHIIKDTNTHNQNLLAKEAAESRARLKDLEHAEEKERRRRAGPQDIRKRQMGDIMSILGDCKDRGRSSRSRRSDEKSQKKESSPPRRKHHKKRRSESPERESARRHHRSRKDESESEREDRRRHRSDRRRSRSPDEKHRRHRHRSPIGDRETMSKSRRSDRGRIRDEEGRDLMSKSHRTRKDRSRERPQSEFSIKGSSRRRRDEGKAQDRKLATTASDSDPLDEFIGPEPPQPVRSRGRGTASGTSGIDKRFEADYNPKTDVEMADNDKHPGENWDDAVEAFRDRQKWRQNQEQRMRAAGYSDEMIKKWTEGGTAGEQKDERDVRWAKAGEKREWDRGKEVGLSWASSESK
ncbi:pre-mRNA-splicing factor 38B [Colletotrichum orchidophilum]|uniref:Pre-mRNA-splicing factor 38B n=1 Tax=Colletotrichum orchidophilum TaxID=1209926 RepID=A0A1G4BDG2_9PEZI|nr:pre-mRNA-splicing factor 38B [Colletotrichum orchidophilum]OHE99376.1 pre-mRNA-splicing factor 38B [Colletotrichum orchidophilum]